MSVQFHKTFPDYRSATMWLHERGYSAAVTFVGLTGACTITLVSSEAA